MYKGISDFKKGYHPRTNIVKEEKGDLVADSHSIFARWRNHSSQQLNVCAVNDVRQTEIHTAEPLVPEASAFEVEMATEKLKSHKLPGIDQIPAELIKAGGRTISSEIHKLINPVWYRKELPEECMESIIIPIYKRQIKQIVVIVEAHHFVSYVQNFIQNCDVKVNSICRGNYWAHQCRF